ncbi:MAG: peptidoglycan-associated lipoprotein Pal [Nitrospirota bacterium]
MRYSGKLYYGLFFILASIFLSGCPKKSEITAAPEPQKDQLTSPAAQTGKDVKSDEPGIDAKERGMAAKESLQPIYFDFNKSSIRDDAKSVMKKNAEWLKSNPNTKIRIQGNCDERGTKEYNQALGQRRSVDAKKYLTAMGVDSGRMSIISFGKEKPVCTENAESCWQKNRRDDFLVENQ